MASFKNLVGGELKGYTELLTESRRQATERMMQQTQMAQLRRVPIPVDMRYLAAAIVLHGLYNATVTLAELTGVF